MRIAILTTGLVAMGVATGYAQTKNLDFELLTWPELKQAIAQGNIQWSELVISTPLLGIILLAALPLMFKLGKTLQVENWSER